jgi:hypothetical protein
MKRFLFLFALSIAIMLPSLARAVPMERHVVRIIVICQSYNYHSPWQKESVERYDITGCVIEGNRILTTSYSLTDHVYIEVTKFGGTKKYPAQVLIKDYHCGLAILKVKDESFFDGLAPIRIRKAGRIAGKKARVFRWDYLGSFKEFTAELNKSSIRFYNPNCGVLMHQFSCGMNDGGDGEPLIIDGDLAGIVTGLNSKTKTIYVIATDVVSRMLKDLSDGSYEGMPFIWFGTIALESDVNLRAYLGMSDQDEGVLVVNVPVNTSGSTVLKPMDVILSVNGKNIYDNGMYTSRNYGKLNYAGIMQINSFVGEEVSMNILRNRVKQTVRFTLKPIPQNCCIIPTISYDAPPNYLVFGGLILQELSVGYLKTWGKDWTKKANKRMLYYYNTMKQIMAESDVNRIVFMNRVLPVQVNHGYQHYKDLILDRVNGIRIKDLGHLKRLLDSTTEEYIRLDFVGGATFIFQKRMVLDSERSLLRKYNIKAPYFINYE